MHKLVWNRMEFPIQEKREECFRIQKSRCQCFCNTHTTCPLPDDEERPRGLTFWRSGVTQSAAAAWETGVGRSAGPLALWPPGGRTLSLWRGGSVPTRPPLACSGSLLWSCFPELSRVAAEGRNRSAACRSWVGRVQSWVCGQGKPGWEVTRSGGLGQRGTVCCIFSLTSRRVRLTTQAAGRVLPVGPAMQVAGDVSPPRRSRFSGQFSLYLPVTKYLRGYFVQSIKCQGQ